MSPQMSQSVGTSHTLAMHRGQRNPSLFMSEWHAQRLSGDESGRRVGKPIIIRSAAGFAFPPPPARVTARWAGGGTSSKSKSLKCPSFIATPNWPVQFIRDNPYRPITSTHHRFYHTFLYIFSSQQPMRPQIFVFYSSRIRQACRECFPGHRSLANQR